MPIHALIIEDNPDIVANLFGYLEPLGYVLDLAHNGNAGLQAACKGAFDVIVLDLSLPGMDGLELCRRLRNEHQIATPVLMLTARDTEKDKLAGFDVGADDYLVKPYSLRELDARVRALIRRARKELTQAPLAFGELTIDLTTNRITRGGHDIVVTPTGFKILLTLLRKAPNLVPREILAREIWGDDPPHSDALRTHIHALRQALDKPFDHPMLVTQPGVGYRLADSDES